MAPAPALPDSLPPLPSGMLAADGCCYDMMYGTEPTVFMQWGEQNGAGQVSDGLGMLVEQAAESFALWRKVRPETVGVIDTLRAR